MDQLVGNELLKGLRLAPTIPILSHKMFVGLYFGAHWSPPSRLFTEQLKDVYETINLDTIGEFEVIFVSDDGNEDAFERNFHKMEWLAVPFSKSSDGK